MQLTGCHLPPLTGPPWAKASLTCQAPSDDDGSATASTHKGGGGGGWASNGGTDGSTAEVVSADVSMQRDTVHIRMAQSALEHALRTEELGFTMAIFCFFVCGALGSLETLGRSSCILKPGTQHPWV